LEVLVNELFVGMIIGAIGLGIVATVTRNQDRNSALKLGQESDNGLPHVQVADDEGYVGDTDEVLALVKRGRKIEAIKIIRAMTGLDLKSAKELVEKMEKGISVDLQSQSHDDTAL
jgi:ribosomal protein L7/L12